MSFSKQQHQQNNSNVLNLDSIPTVVLPKNALVLISKGENTEQAADEPTIEVTAAATETELCQLLL